MKGVKGTTPQCSVVLPDGSRCANLSSAWGRCTKHHHRFVRHGDPLAGCSERGLSPSAYFYAKVVEGTVPEFAPHLGPCKLWTGAHVSKGYGSFTYKAEGGRTVTVSAHAWAYRDAGEPNGQISEEQPCLDHLCRVRDCVEPSHLEPVSNEENLRRGRAKGFGVLYVPPTHCRNGHPFTAENSYPSAARQGKRICRTCHRARCAERKARQMELEQVAA